MIIAPSLLAANFGKFADEVRRIERSGSGWIHLDVMDGHFVPNISFGPEVVRIVRETSKTLFLDVHLMCSEPETLLDTFIKVGADSITVHVELAEKVPSLLWKIRAAGKKVGLAVNPPTRVDLCKPFLGKIDLLLVMTVNPGFGGQSFIEECVPKVQQAAAWRKERKLNYRIEVDGGINDDRAAECARAGADTFVSGTALLKQRQLKTAVNRMKRAAAEATGELFRISR